MIRLDITARNFEADDKIRDYVQEKIGGLDKYLPRDMRGATRGQVVLESDASGREDNQLVCEVILMVGGTKLQSREGTVNMYAAIDIVVAKLKSQIRTYKDKTTGHSGRGRLLNRLLRREAPVDPIGSSADPIA
jgi:putative sigma-54 modulation protein